MESASAYASGNVDAAARGGASKDRNQGGSNRTNEHRGINCRRRPRRPSVHSRPQPKPLQHQLQPRQYHVPIRRLGRPRRRRHRPSGRPSRSLPPRGSVRSLVQDSEPVFVLCQSDEIPMWFESFTLVNSTVCFGRL